MKMCCPPLLYEQSEFSISNTPIKNNKIKELFPIDHDLYEFKEKIICEFLNIIDKLECGIQPDLEFLLEEISLVDITENE